MMSPSVYELEEKTEEKREEEEVVEEVMLLDGEGEGDGVLIQGFVGSDL